MFQTHSSPITCATLHPNNTELIIADQSGTIHLWNLKNDKTEQLVNINWHLLITIKIKSTIKTGIFYMHIVDS